MKTMKVNLNVLQSVTSQHSIVETDTQFQLPVSLGGGATLVLTCPKELPAEGPGLPIDPFSCVADVRGCLDEFFAGIEPAAEGEPVFQMPVVSAQLGTFTPASEETPAQFAVSVSPSEDVPHALIRVQWALNNPPPPYNRLGGKADEYAALFAERIDFADPEAANYFGDDVGVDLWILPIEAIGDLRHRIAKSWELRNDSSEVAYRLYRMSAPRYCERLHEYDERVRDFLHWHLTYGEDYGELVIFPGEENETAFPITYNKSGLKLLSEAVMDGMRAKMMGDFVDVLGCLFG